MRGCVLIRQDTRKIALFSLWHARTHQEGDHLQPRSGPWPEACHAGTLILVSQPPKLGEINACFLSKPIYGTLLWQPEQNETETLPDVSFGEARVSFQWQKPRGFRHPCSNPQIQATHCDLGYVSRVWVCRKISGTRAMKMTVISEDLKHHHAPLWKVRK